MSPGKAYVKGYEVEKLATQYIDVDKARDFNTESNFSTRFDICLLYTSPSPRD